MKSLRARLLVGAVLWTVGIGLVFNLAVNQLLRHYPGRVVHYLAMSIFAASLLALGLLQVRTGLTLLRELRARLKAVSDGSDRRVRGSYPSEFQPLVDDLNALLEDREQSVARAQSKAGDLAHGLKTPLAVLSQEAVRAAAAGQSELAATLEQQVERMRRHVDYHLAHARAAASGARPGTRSSVADSLAALARTLQRLHVERGIRLELQAPADHTVRVERQDLDEMIGNLLDNACKWARSAVRVASARERDAVVVTIEDDGPGLAEALRDAVLQRGVRADEAAPGSGLGLAIVRDLAELYGGGVELDAAPSGGLRARLRLPGA
jgi:signal transduction histidine kinase